MFTGPSPSTSAGVLKLLPDEYLQVLFFLFFRPCCVAGRILVPQLGTEPPRELPPWRLFEELLSGEKVFKKLTP